VKIRGDSSNAYYRRTFATKGIPPVQSKVSTDTSARVMERRHVRVNADALLLIRSFAVLRNRADVRLHVCYFQWHAIDSVCRVAGIAA
jgi:hypothetical protein